MTLRDDEAAAPYEISGERIAALLFKMAPVDSGGNASSQSLARRELAFAGAFNQGTEAIFPAPPCATAPR
jgi:hypothetical protein